MALLQVLVSVVQEGHADRSLDAAICIGLLNVVEPTAKKLLLQAMRNSSFATRAKALHVLIKQMNSKDVDVIDALLQQIGHATNWKHRMEALNLLVHIGGKHLASYGMDRLFAVLEFLLWNHPSKEFCKRVAEVITDLGLRDQACSLILRRLADPDESVRRGAVVALATLGMKGKRELKMLLDLLDLDSSLRIRIQVIRAFQLLRWNDPRILVALQEREKGDGLLSIEAAKALKVLAAI